jgi:hypothetical protein
MIQPDDDLVHPHNQLLEHLQKILPGAWSSDHRSHRVRLDFGDRRLIVRLVLPGRHAVVADVTGTGVDPTSYGQCSEFSTDLPRIVTSCVQEMLYRRSVHASDVPTWAHDLVRSLAIPRKHNEARARYETLISEINASVAT